MVKSRIRLATSIVLRQNREDPRVYLVKRNPKLRYFGGYWAFPGGTVDAQDARECELVESPRGDEAAFMLSGARELFEELGLDLAVAPVAVDESESFRREVLEDGGRYVEAMKRRHASVPGARFHDFARLLTPAFSPIRFDTIFYRVDLDEGESLGKPSIIEGELVDGCWDTPAAWLQRWRSGEILIAPPVVLMLRILEQHAWAGADAELVELTRGFARGKLHPIFYNPAVQLLPLETPTLPPATHTNAYLIGRDPAYLVDPASPHPAEQARLDEALQEATQRGRRLSAILLTHHHPDHVGAVEHVRERWKLPVWAHPISADLLAGKIAIDRTLEEGDRLSLGTAPNGREGWELEVHFTPGHAAGHIVFFEREYGSLVLGDMMSTLSSILVHPDDGDMALYESSLARICELPSQMIFPAHGPGNATGPEVLRAQLNHRRARQAAILACIGRGASEIGQVVTEVYGDIPHQMHGYAALSVRSVLNKLEKEGKVRLDGDSLRPA